jgi:hypothetical protein
MALVENLRFTSGVTDLPISSFRQLRTSRGYVGENTFLDKVKKRLNDVLV